jgi:hypothetical protein
LLRLNSEAHKTSGRATIYKQADGTRLLELTDFSTSNGPQLRVLLVDGQDPEASKDFSPTAVKNVDLGSLKGNQGDQSYPLPSEADLRKFNTVTIYCECFHANFGSTVLQDWRDVSARVTQGSSPRSHENRMEQKKTGSR